MVAKLELTEAQKDVLLALDWHWPRYAHRLAPKDGGRRAGKARWRRNSPRVYKACLSLAERGLAKHTDHGWLLTSDGEEIRRLVAAERRA